MSARKILLLGKNGQVGWELQRALAPLGDVVALGSAEADFRNPAQVREPVSYTHLTLPTIYSV